MERTMDLRSLFSEWMRKIALILACTIFVGVLFLAYSVFFKKNTYTTSVSLLVHNAATVNQNSSTISDLNASTQLAGQFIDILKNESILSRVAESVGNDPLTGMPRATAKSLSEMLAFSTSNSILKIQATASDPRLCIDVCEAMATRGAELLREKVEASSVQRIESTKEDIVKPRLVSKHVLRNTVLGMILGALLAIVPITIVFLFDETIKEGDDLSALFGVPVLGEIPPLTATNQPGKKGSYYREKRK